MKTVAFINQKGGVGKTTSVATIGSLLAAEHRYKVLLIDLDSQSHLSDHFGIFAETNSIYDVLVNGLPPADAVRTAFGVDILPANLDLSAAEVELAAAMSRELRLKKNVSEFCQRYDYVLIDCQPSLGLLPINALAFAESVIVPMEAEYLALRGLAQLQRTISLVAENLNPNLSLMGILFCMYSGNTALAKNVKDEVLKAAPEQVFRHCARRNVKLAEAPGHGMPVNFYDPQCSGAEDYREITLEFLQRLPLAGVPQNNSPLPFISPVALTGEKKKLTNRTAKSAAVRTPGQPAKKKSPAVVAVNSENLTDESSEHSTAEKSLNKKNEIPTTVSAPDFSPDISVVPSKNFSYSLTDSDLSAVKNSIAPIEENADENRDENKSAKAKVINEAIIIVPNWLRVPAAEPQNPPLRPPRWE